MRRLILILALLTASPLQAGEVRIAVAANFTDAMRELVALFEQGSKDHVIPVFASTGKLYAQAKHGAPFDIFLSADSLRAKRAAAEGLAVPGSRLTYALGKLYLVADSALSHGDAEALLRAGDFRHLAIANPKTAPYGLAAIQTLQAMGLWEQCMPKIVRGESVAQTFQFIATKNAEAGFVAASQLKGLSPAFSSWEVPDSYYQPIAQQAVLLKHGQDNTAAHAFLEFLKSSAARQIILSFGYRVE